MSRSFHLVIYGCQMNVHDGERVSGVLRAAGWDEATSPGAADAVILMTCCVRGSAEDRFWGNLQAMKSLKRGGRPLIAVGGCIAQNEGVEVFTRAPHVDLVFGTRQYPRIAELLEEASASPVCSLEMPGLDLAGLPRTQAEGFRAWVPVIHGCNNFCSYCVVPYTRGREVSRPRTEIMGEIGGLVESGAREVILLGQNVNSYGRDLSGTSEFASLLEEVATRWPDTWIRFLTSHPRDFTPDIVEAMQEHPNVCRYVHLPLQAGSNAILSAMHRGYGREEYLARVASIREALPDAVVSTDIIVGYPGETEGDFLQTLDAVRVSAYDMAYTYVYNRREGTRAAESGEPEVPREVMMERFDRLAALVRELALTSNLRDVGKEFDVLVDGHSRKADPPRLRGRTRTNKVVNLPGDPALIGTVVRVKVVGAGHWSLQADAARQGPPYQHHPERTGSRENHRQPSRMNGAHDLVREKALVDGAIALGADGAMVVSTEMIRVEDHFPGFCLPPGCSNYGLSANCPPHVMRPAEFREELKRYERALVFRIDVPMQILLAEERTDVTRLLQEITAALERMAAGAGYDRPWGIACGCCKQLFCREHEACSVLAGGKCRNPDRARTSMSGLGVNFNLLSGSLGWAARGASSGDASGDGPLGMLVGIVLLG